MTVPTLSDKELVNPGDAPQPEQKPLLNRKEMFKTMITYKQRRLNLSRWLAKHQKEYGVTAAEAKKYWDSVK